MVYTTEQIFEPNPQRLKRVLLVDASGGGSVRVDIKHGDNWVNSGDGELTDSGTYVINQYLMEVRVVPTGSATFDYQ